MPGGLLVYFLLLRPTFTRATSSRSVLKLAFSRARIFLSQFLLSIQSALFSFRSSRPFEVSYSATTRSSSRKISAPIAKLAAQDLLDSGDEIDMDLDADEDITLVQSGEEEEEDDEDQGQDQDEDEDDDENEDEDDDEVPDADDDDSDDEDEVVVLPKKRKRGGSKKKSNELRPRDIEYKIRIFSAAEMKKATSARRPVTEAVILRSDVPWATLKTKILTQINNALDPPSLNFHEYNITFTVPRQVSDPMQLTDHHKYEYLVKKALRIQKDPSAKVHIEQKVDSAANKENGVNQDEGDDVAAKQGKKKTTKVPKARDILPANVALNEKIGELRESAHCYFNEINPEHMPLWYDHFKSWGAATLKGNAFADIETPPNNELFDKVSQGARGAKSPLLQRRLELQQEATARQAPPAPQVHLNFGAEIAGLFRAAAAPPLLLLLCPTPSSLPPTRQTCSSHSHAFPRFKQQRFKRTTAFKFVEVPELKEMGFMKGEVAELKVAIEEWSHAPE
ncbi:hypothetical protein B0H13DRAFT_2483972 [Mycena leptocephala]|nr:hypothetical protein B0H13DRAFT_2483972 [Mycena leptocephala]